MKTVKLVKINSNHKSLRTDEIEGVTEKMPEVGSSFILLAPPLESGDVRAVVTTPVETVKFTGQTYEFRTKNSEYELILL